MVNGHVASGQLLVFRVGFCSADSNREQTHQRWRLKWPDWFRWILKHERLDIMLITLTLALYYLGLFAMSFMQEADSADFYDLGKLLFGGFVLAIAVALAFTFVKLHLREKKPPVATFISIGSYQKKK